MELDVAVRVEDVSVDEVKDVTVGVVCVTEVSVAVSVVDVAVVEVPSHSQTHVFLVLELANPTILIGPNWSFTSRGAGHVWNFTHA